MKRLLAVLVVSMLPAIPACAPSATAVDDESTTTAAATTDQPAVTEETTPPTPPVEVEPSPAEPVTVVAPADEMEIITFDELNLNMQPDVVFRPFFLTERVKQLDGRKIQIEGYIDGVSASSVKNLQEFVLLKNTECKFGPGGQADHLISVRMVDGKKTDFTSKVIQVEGILSIKPFEGPDGNTWSIYELSCDAVRERPRLR